ncbi:MAG: PilT/PilU family type 4a pilus ATPase [Planctomycetota bacterium]
MKTSSPKLQQLLQMAVQSDASDVILKAGGCPAMRAAGGVRFLGDTPLSHEAVEAFVAEVLDERGMTNYRRRGSADASLSAGGLGRFRCNAFHQCGNPAMVLRRIRSDVPPFKDLHLPVEPLKELAARRRGLVLVTGTAGSGKSTTLASMIEYINRSSSKHIVTVEDPIEYLFTDKRSLVNQREVGTDAPSFPAALRDAVRQAPDVIMIGEMRDRETTEAALAAAETGHLVLSTLHTVNAVQTVERIITFFEPYQHDLIRLQLSLNLAGVVSMRLIRTREGTGRLPAVELLINTPSVREMLEKGETRKLPQALAEGAHYGTMTFNQSLIRLFDAGNIPLEEALAASDNPDELKMQMRGITRGGVTAGV